MSYGVFLWDLGFPDLVSASWHAGPRPRGFWGECLPTDGQDKSQSLWLQDLGCQYTSQLVWGLGGPMVVHYSWWLSLSHGASINPLVGGLGPGHLEIQRFL